MYDSCVLNYRIFGAKWNGSLTMRFKRRLTYVARLVVGWAMRDTLDAELAMSALASTTMILGTPSSPAACELDRC